MKRLKNENGLGLIEILATLVILTIITLFFTSILQSSNKEKIDQQTATKQLTNTTYSLKVITKDFRRATEFWIPSSDHLKLKIGGNDVKYKIDSSSGSRNLVKEENGSTEIITEDIGCFYVNYLGTHENQKMELKISSKKSTTDCTISTPSDDIIRTELQLRKGR